MQGYFIVNLIITVINNTLKTSDFQAQYSYKNTFV